jgi:hypothetical protein
MMQVKKNRAGGRRRVLPSQRNRKKDKKRAPDG